ncbi:transporter substrate-binding domain-containing protein [Kiloniella laminariae]|uniref:Transporter substrate-binding domain-containing protein n=1 Tax=Kiloniella laminariae TaxID=454162 RepID=A0ABT4LFA2_9PROT|nr:transporter substrate-binding domain-containing protein [Kiloniella laminariae]MCZ4279768.1 transporter substrate-binding domain-containing protein [Kiloniella laminariae]
MPPSPRSPTATFSLPDCLYSVSADQKARPFGRIFTPWVGLFMALLLSVLLALSTARAAELSLVTEEYPPLNMYGPEGEITGVATELLRLAAKDIDLKLDIRLLPWKRGYFLARNRPETCIYSTWRTEEREDLFLWVGPLASDAWSFYARADSKIRLSRLQDTFDYNVGLVDGWGFTEHLQKSGHPKLDLVPANDETNVRKLLSGRIDLWGTGRISGQQILKGEQYEQVKEIFAIREIGLWVACNKNTDPALLTELQNALDKLEQNGSAEKIRAAF